MRRLLMNAAAPHEHHLLGILQGEVAKNRKKNVSIDRDDGTREPTTAF